MMYRDIHKDIDITSREYLRRRIWSDAWVAGMTSGSMVDADRWAYIALEAYDRQFRDSEGKG